MVTTGNKICGVCGCEISTISALYTAPEMNDNCYMCDSCRSKCSPFLNDQLIHAWKKYDAENHMAFLAECSERIQSDFQETASVSSGGRKILAFDEQKKWWYIPGTSDIFRFEQIKSWTLDVSIDLSDSADLHVIKFTPPRPGMPVPGRFDEMRGLTLVIELNEHPYAEVVRTKIVGPKGLLTFYGTYLKDAYAIAAKCYELLEKYSDPRVTGKII